MTIGAALELGTLFFAYFVLALLIAVAIAYAAWKGKPKSFDREMYWTMFVAAGAVGGLSLVYVQRHTDTLPGLVVYVGLILGALLFGVSAGFGIGALVRRRDTLPPFVE
jgi:uncharacterized protein YybS (DUF2232 family)